MLYPQSYVNATLEDPKISMHSFASCGNCTCFVVEAAKPAAWVALDTPLAGRFSSNAMALVPNRPENVSFCGWTAASTEAVALSVTATSVYDTQAAA